MDKGLIALVFTMTTASGAAVGLFTESLHDKLYAENLRDPAFYHLVDEFGNPMSQNFDQGDSTLD